MSDLETRIRTWVDARTAGVDPVTTDEVLARAHRAPITLQPVAPTQHRRQVALAAAIALLVLAATVAAAILLTRDDTHDVITDTTTSEGLVRLARLVPDDLDDSLMVHLADYELARELAGAVRPGPGAPPSEQDAYLGELGAAGYWPHQPLAELVRSSQDPFGSIREELGIDLAQVAAAAQWGAPPDIVMVLIGEFDPERIDEAARTLPEPWSDALVVGEHRGVAYYSWFDDFETDISRRLDTNTLGRARRLALVGDHLVITSGTDALERTIDAILDHRSSTAAALIQRASLAADHYTVTLWEARTVEGVDMFLLTNRTPEPPGELGPPIMHLAISGDPSEVGSAIESAIERVRLRYGWSDDMADAIQVSTEGTMITIEARLDEVTTAEDPDTPNVRVAEDLIAQIYAELVGAVPEATSP